MGPMKKKRRRLQLLLLVALLAASYPTFVLTYTWSRVLKSELPGGRHGPLDAYRHTLASAVVAYTLNQDVVRLVNKFMEKRGKRSNTMDIHNNLVGATIGAHSVHFADIEPAVKAAISAGAVHATQPGQVTWLEPDKWQDGKLR